MTISVVEADSVSKRYGNGTVALTDFSLSIPRGQMVALLGPSGSGKTTFFRLCNGAVRPTAGSIDVLGVSLAHARGRELRRLRARVSVVYQVHNLVGSMSVLHNVLLGRIGKLAVPRAIKEMMIPGQEEHERVHQLLDQLGIGDKLFARADELSGGQRQRVAIARALIQEPELLLADEPVASVDAETATVILDMLARAQRERGVTVVVSLHQPEYVERYCDRTVELQRGILVEDRMVNRQGLASSPFSSSAFSAGVAHR